MGMDSKKTVLASKVRKGTLILIDGTDGPQVVTRREKVETYGGNTFYRIHHVDPKIATPQKLHHHFEYVAGNVEFELYEGETCKLCKQKYMPASSGYDGFCGYGCSSGHAFITT